MTNDIKTLKTNLKQHKYYEETYCIVYAVDAA